MGDEQIDSDGEFSGTTRRDFLRRIGIGAIVAAPIVALAGCCIPGGGTGPTGATGATG